MLSKNLLIKIKSRAELLNSLKPLSPENQAKLDKKFRLEFNFNSNHLEGNTLTYGETELLLIFDQTEGTHDFREYQEMQAHDVALKMIQEEASDQERPLTEQFIRSLNAKLLVKPFWKEAITADGQPTRKQIIPGEYKKTPNSVRLANGEIFAYSSPEDVQNEIAELVMWFNEKNLREDPVLMAAMLHYRFVRIHPFDDGNGRTARLLMNYVFFKNNLPLVIIRSAEKKDYLAALNRADTGDLNAFVEYIGKQLLWSLDISIRAANGDNIEDDDDLDKELELLKQELKQVPNEFEKEKTNQDVSKIMEGSIVPLFQELNSKLEKISDLFVKIESNLHVKKYGFDEDLILLPHDFLFGYSFDIYQINSCTINLECIALKKSVRQKNINYILQIEFDGYNYRIYNKLNSEELIILSYNNLLSKHDIDSIVKSIMRYVIIEIKQATNLNN